MVTSKDRGITVIKTLTQNRWLLALSGLFNAIVSVVYLIMYQTGPDGANGTGVFLSRLAVAAGACTIAAGIWKSATGRCWLLVVNGAALTAFGLLPLVWRGRLSVTIFELLALVIAVTLALVALDIATTLRRHVVPFRLTAALSFGFALAFLALANRWIQLQPRPFHPAVFLWFCYYFCFNAICLLGIGLWLHSSGQPQSGPREALPPLTNPEHAH